MSSSFNWVKLTRDSIPWVVNRPHRQTSKDNIFGWCLDSRRTISSKEPFPTKFGQEAVQRKRMKIYYWFLKLFESNFSYQRTDGANYWMTVGTRKEWEVQWKYRPIRDVPGLEDTPRAKRQLVPGGDIRVGSDLIKGPKIKIRVLQKELGKQMWYLVSRCRW